MYIIHVTNHVREVLGKIDCQLLETNSYPVYLVKIAVVILITFIVLALYGVICNYISNRTVKGIDAKTKGYFEFK